MSVVCDMVKGALTLFFSSRVSGISKLSPVRPMGMVKKCGFPREMWFPQGSWQAANLNLAV